MAMWRLLVQVLLAALTGGKAAEPAQARDPFGLAASYGAASCRAAIQRNNFSRWLRTEPTKTWIITELIYPDERLHPGGYSNGTFGRPFGFTMNVRYVHDPKAGSKMMWTGGLKASLGITPGVGAARQGTVRVFYPPRRSSIKANEFVFTVVREPVARFLAGYLEISHRRVIRSGRFWNMTCGQERFRVFVDEILQGLRLSPDVFHVWPQAHTVNVVDRRARKAQQQSPRAAQVRRFDAIARLEHLEEDMTKIRQAVRRQPGKVSASERARFFSQEHHSHTKDPCAHVDFKDPELMRKLCSALEVDYICFQYPPPEICRELFPRYAHGARRAAAMPLGAAAAEPASATAASARTSPAFAETAAAASSARQGGAHMLAPAAAAWLLSHTQRWE